MPHLFFWNIAHMMFPFFSRISVFISSKIVINFSFSVVGLCISSFILLRICAANAVLLPGLKPCWLYARRSKHSLYSLETFAVTLDKILCNCSISLVALFKQSNNFDFFPTSFPFVGVVPAIFLKTFFARAFCISNESLNHFYTPQVFAPGLRLPIVSTLPILLWDLFYCLVFLLPGWFHWCF